MMPVSDRETALQEIKGLATRFNLSPKEITVALSEGSAPSTSNKALLFFLALGGIFIFSGIGAFVHMFWEEMNRPSRVVITLGSGLALFGMGLFCALSQDPKHRKGALPLFLMAALMEPTGLFVLLHEYFDSHRDLRYACLLVFGVMFVQQAATFVAVRQTVLLFTSIVFGSFLFATAFSLMGMRDEWSAAVIGLSLLHLSYALDKAALRRLAAAGYFFGGLLFLGGAFGVLEATRVEILYLGLACFLIYLSTVVRSVTLMIVSVIAMLGYIAYFTDKHFVHSIGWPAALILVGLICVGTGIGAVRLKRRYL